MPTGIVASTDSIVRVSITPGVDFDLVKGSNQNEASMVGFAEGTISSDTVAGDYDVKLVNINGKTLDNATAEIDAIKAINPPSAKSYLDAAAEGTNAYAIIRVDGEGNAHLIDGYQHSQGDDNYDMIIPNNYPAGVYTFQAVFVDESGNTLTETLVLEVI
jgi:hypothetical protein